MDQPALTLGPRRPERADAARNRQVLLATAREMLAELGADKITMDALAERAGVGKGTVFRRFGTRAGIFQALLDDDERDFQERVLSGPPPLGPGAAPLDRLIAYGQARISFLTGHREIARNALDGSQPVPAGSQTPCPVRISGTCCRRRVSAPPMWTCWPSSSPPRWTVRCSSTCPPDILAQTAPQVSGRLGRGWQEPGPARIAASDDRPNGVVPEGTQRYRAWHLCRRGGSCPASTAQGMQSATA